MFEPVVMFFGMTNSPATFQEMMNKFLRDIINEGKVAAFVDDILVGTETEEGHDKVVEEVLRRLEENYLYIKPEKCIWKVKKVPSLGVVMGEKKVEIEKKIHIDLAMIASQWSELAVHDNIPDNNEQNFKRYDQ